MIPATHSAEKTRMMPSDDHNTRLNEDLYSGKDLMLTQIPMQAALLLDFKAPYHTAKRPEYQCTPLAI